MLERINGQFVMFNHQKSLFSAFVSLLVTFSLVNAQAITPNPLRPASVAAPVPNRMQSVGQLSYEQPMLVDGGEAVFGPAEFSAGEFEVGEFACDACGMPGGGNCSACGMSRLWGSIEYLMWWEEGSDLPLLVTSSEAGTDRDIAGVEGFATTRTVFGNETVEDNPLNGLRLTLGLWSKGGDYCGFGLQYFGLEKRSFDFNATSRELPILARPFFNITLDERDSLLLGFPDLFAGNINIRSTSENQGGSFFFRSLARTGCNYRFDWILGYRYLAADEGLFINNRLQFLEDDGLTPAGTVISQRDDFDFSNRFHGLDLGMMGQSRDGRWMMDVWGRVAIGNMHQQVDINGSSTTTLPNFDPAAGLGGLLTQRSNIGRFEADEFAIVPELTVNLGYEISCHFDFWVGYTALYANRVARMSQGLDRAVNLTQLTGTTVGEPRPIYVIEDTDFLLQGLNFGLNFTY